jgi:hypothetical protein
MKTVLMTLSFFLILSMTMPSHAGHRHHRGCGHNSHFNGGHIFYNNHYNRNHHSHRGAYLLGGVVLGSLLTQAYNNNDNYRRSSERRVVYNDRDRRSVPDRVLLRDKFGYCYVVTQKDGVEVRTQTDWEACQ